MRQFLIIIAMAAWLFLQGCAAPENRAVTKVNEPNTDAQNKSSQAAWQHVTLPSKKNTSYSFLKKDGRDIIMANAQSSASMLRRDLRIPASELDTVKFSWQVQDLIHEADLAKRDLDDSPVRIVLIFEGDKRKFSAQNAMLSEMAELLSGEPLPYATLMYVWCNKCEPGSVVVNPHTDRIRSIVVESGAGNLRQWLDYERHIRADFEKAFGEAPGDLVRVGIMSDSDNTKSQAIASYGQLRFVAGRK